VTTRSCGTLLDPLFLCVHYLSYAGDVFEEYLNSQVSLGKRALQKMEHFEVTNRQDTHELRIDQQNSLRIFRLDFQRQWVWQLM